MATPLQYVARIRYGMGQPPPLTDDGGIPIIRATNIDRGRITTANLQRAQLEVLPLDRAPLLRAGEILIVRSGAYTGDSALVSGAWAGSAPGYDLRVTPGPGVNPRFLSWCLLSRYCLDQLDLMKTRAAQPHLNAEELSSLRVPTPPLEVQLRIADYLDTETTRIDALVDKVVGVQKLLAERRTSTVGQLLAEPARERPLRYCLANFIGGDWGADVGEVEHDVRVYRAADFDRGRHLVRHERAPVRSVTTSSLRGRELREGDVIIEKSGGGEHQPVGCTVIYRSPPEGTTAIPSNFNARLVPAPDVDAEYLNLVLAALYRLGRTRPFINQTTGIQNLDLSAYLDVRVPVPDLARQQQVARQVLVVWDRLDRLTASLNVQARLLNERRQALITAAVTGELEV